MSFGDSRPPVTERLGVTIVSEHFLIAKQIQTDLLPEDHPDLLDTIRHHEQLQKRDRSKN